MVPIRRIFWLWLGLGIAVFVYGVNTGDGPAGLLLYWELEAFGSVFPATHMFLSIPLIFVPIILLARDADRRRTKPIDVPAAAKRLGNWFTIAGLLLAGAAGLCYWRTTLLPSPGAAPLRVALDEIPTGSPVAEHRSVLVGILQRSYAVRYDEVMTGRFRTGSRWAHHFVPMTPSGWTPDQQVRFLVDTRGNPISSVFSPGLLLRGQLPGFVRRALTNKGLVIANDVMVLSGDRDFGRTGWYVSTAFCSIGAFVGLALGWAWPRARSRTEAELTVLRPRVARSIAYTIGGFLILVSSILAIQKAVHVTSMASAAGVITGTQQASHSIGRYSFYVEYTTPQGRFHHFAHTWTPFSKEVGDRVVVLYDPTAPEVPEILAFDDNWAAYAILFIPGIAIVIAAALL